MKHKAGLPLIEDNMEGILTARYWNRSLANRQISFFTLGRRMHPGSIGEVGYTINYTMVQYLKLYAYTQAN